MAVGTPYHHKLSGDDFQNYLDSLACFSNLMIEIVCKEIMKVTRLSSLLLLRFLLEILTCLHYRSDKMEFNDSEISFFSSLAHTALTTKIDKLFGNCYTRIRVTSLLELELADSNAYARKSTTIFKHFKY